MVKAEAVAFTPAETKASFIIETAPVPPTKDVFCIAKALALPVSPNNILMLPVAPVAPNITLVKFIPSEIPICIGGDVIGTAGPCVNARLLALV